MEKRSYVAAVIIGILMLKKCSLVFGCGIQFSSDFIYKGRYFPRTSIEKDAAVKTLITDSEFLCGKACSSHLTCIAVSFFASYVFSPNCHLFDLANVKDYFEHDENSIVILQLPIECGFTSTVNGKWSAWSVTVQCSKSCGSGQLTKSRFCTNPECNGEPCTGVNEVAEACNVQECPVNGEWSIWSTTGSCSATCGGGERRDTRTCDSPAPEHGGNTCEGSETKITQCNSDPCQNTGWLKITGSPICFGAKDDTPAVFIFNQMTGRYKIKLIYVDGEGVSCWIDGGYFLPFACNIENPIEVLLTDNSKNILIENYEFEGDPDSVGNVSVIESKIEPQFVSGEYYKVYYVEDFWGINYQTENNGGLSCIDVEIFI